MGTVVSMASNAGTFQQRLVGTINAELARRNLNRNDLTEPLGLGRNAIYARFRGERPFTVTELATIAEFLDVDLEAFFATNEQVTAA